MALTQQQIDGLVIMIIDDEPFMRKLIIRVLNEIGIFNIEEANNGAEGLNQLATATERPTLIICDLEMPGIDGFEFVRKLRAAKDEQFKNLPVLIVTGHAEPESVRSAVDAGIHGYLVKPISRQALESRIATALETGPIDPGRMNR